MAKKGIPTTGLGWIVLAILSILVAFWQTMYVKTVIDMANVMLAGLFFVGYIILYYLSNINTALRS